MTDLLSARPCLDPLLLSAYKGDDEQSTAAAILVIHAGEGAVGAALWQQ